MQSIATICCISTGTTIPQQLVDVLTDDGYAFQSLECEEPLLAALSAGEQCDCVITSAKGSMAQGMELLQRVSAMREHLPLVLIASACSIDDAVGAVKAGVADVISTPFTAVRLRKSIADAILEYRLRVAEQRVTQNVISKRYDLSPRKLQVLNLVVAGMTSRQIAVELGISVRTVENYRAFVLEHIGVDNTAQLIRSVMSSKKA